jgi:hypothetical protein
MVTQIMKGVTAETLESGVRFMRVHYSADPEKDQEWAATERRKEADPRNWDTQMEMRRIITDGIPVYSRYSDAVHCPESGSRQYFELVPGSIYLGGWDAGQTLSPAFVLLEWQTNPVKVRALLEVTGAGLSMEEFAPMVTEKITGVYPEIIKLIRHFGDPTIQTRSGSDKATAQQVARKYDFEIKASTNVWDKRKSAVDHLLLHDGLFEVNRFGCPVLHRGFLGMYKFEASARGEGSGAGQVLMTPLKNQYSHIQDALQYPAMEIFDALVPGGQRKWVSG